MPLTIYATVCEFLTTIVPIACIISLNMMKYFNTSLVYTIIMMVSKIMQILSLWFFTKGQLGICMVALSTRIPMVLVAFLELICMGILAWLLKRVKRINR